MIIYKLISPSGKIYIGKTKDIFENRFKQHIQLWKKLKKKNIAYNHCPVKLFYAFDKYAPEQWQHEILEECNTLSQLNQREKYYIKKLNTINNGYNITKGGDGRFVDFLTNEHRNNISKSRNLYWKTEDGLKRKEKMSVNFSKNNPGIDWTGRQHTEESKEKNRQSHLGKKMSKETKYKHSETMKDLWKIGTFNNRPLPSKETIQKRADSARGFKQTDYQKQRATEALEQAWLIITPDGETFNIVNLNKYCKEHGLDQGNMVKVSKGILKQHKGYKVSKI